MSPHTPSREVHLRSSSPSHQSPPASMGQDIGGKEASHILSRFGPVSLPPEPPPPAAPGLHQDSLDFPLGVGTAFFSHSSQWGERSTKSIGGAPAREHPLLSGRGHRPPAVHGSLLSRGSSVSLSGTLQPGKRNEPQRFLPSNPTGGCAAEWAVCPAAPVHIARGGLESGGRWGRGRWRLFSRKRQDEGRQDRAPAQLHRGSRPHGRGCSGGRRRAERRLPAWPRWTPRIRASPGGERERLWGSGAGAAPRGGCRAGPGRGGSDSPPSRKWDCRTRSPR